MITKRSSPNKIGLPPLNAAALKWVAGLLEGEGYFSRHHARSTARNVIAGCVMTDLDVLMRLRAYVGAGSISGPRQPKYHGSRKDHPGYKPQWHYRIFGLQAYDLMKQLLPEMGARRRARIEELLRDYDGVVDHVFQLRHLSTNRVETTTEYVKWCKEHSVSRTQLDRTWNGEVAAAKGWRRET